MATLFDLTTQNIEDIAIIPSYGGSNCSIVRNDNINTKYEGFILRNGPKAQTVCNVSFIPSSISGKFVPRIEFRVVYTINEQIKTTDKKDVRIPFLNKEEGYSEFWKMVGFLIGFKDIVDTGDFKSIYKVTDINDFILSFKSKDQAEKVKELSSIILHSELNDSEIKSALKVSRAATLKEFEKLINVSEYLSVYKAKNSINEIGEEAVWHHFLKNTPWILGLTLDIRFIRDLITETNVGTQDTTGKGSPHSDALGIRDYTVLIEFKTPNTNIFTEVKKNTSRTNTWSFSDYFIDGISQCLGQKFDWEDNHSGKDLVDPKTNKVIDQNQTRTLDPKTIFIIGSKKKEIPEDSKDKDVIIKRDTFELFRRNSRNIEIITYDELYERAYYIVHGVKL